MAFPTVDGTIVTSDNDSAANVTDHPIDLPTGILSGHLLLVVLSSDGNRTVSWPAGWNEIFDANGAVGVTAAAAYRVADGTEGSQITAVTSGGEKCTGIAMKINGHDSTANPPEAGTAVFGDSTAPNPPSLTPSGGAKDYLWVATCHIDANKTVDGFPTNYGSNNTQVQGTGGANCSSGLATRDLNATSEDPGAFTIGTEQWGANVIAIFPGSESGAAGGGSNPIVAAPAAVSSATLGVEQTQTVSAVSAAVSSATFGVGQTHAVSAVSAAVSSFGAAVTASAPSAPGSGLGGSFRSKLWRPGMMLRVRNQ